MTLATKKRVVAGGFFLLVCVANASLFVHWLDTIGFLGLVQDVRDRYVTGTAITVIAALVILLPSGTAVTICAQRCRVCDSLFRQGARYCSECGSKM